MNVASGSRVAAPRSNCARAAAGSTAAELFAAELDELALRAADLRSSAALRLQHTYPGDFSNTHCTGESSSAAKSQPSTGRSYQRCTSTIGMASNASRPSMPNAGASSRIDARRRGGTAMTQASHAAPVAAAQLHAGDAVGRRDARPTTAWRRCTASARAAAASASRASGTRQVRDARRIAVAEKRRADDEEPHLADTRSSGALSAGTRNGSQNARNARTLCRCRRNHEAMSPLRCRVAACSDQRASHQDPVERGEVRISREPGHEVHRRRQPRRAQVRGRTVARKHGHLEARLDVEGVAHARARSTRSSVAVQQASTTCCPQSTSWPSTSKDVALPPSRRERS